MKREGEGMMSRHRTAAEWADIEEELLARLKRSIEKYAKEQGYTSAADMAEEFIAQRRKK